MRAEILAHKHRQRQRLLLYSDLFANLYAKTFPDGRNQKKKHAKEYYLAYICNFHCKNKLNKYIECLHCMLGLSIHTHMMANNARPTVWETSLSFGLERLVGFGDGGWVWVGRFGLERGFGLDRLAGFGKVS